MLKIQSQQKEDLLYVGWMKAATQAKRVKQNWNRERVNRERFQSKANVTIASSPKSHQNQHSSLGKNRPYQGKEGTEGQYIGEPMDTSHKSGADIE